VALNNLGVISQALNDQDAARKLYADSIALAREHGDRDVEASSLNGLGGIALDHGDYGEAWRHHEDALGVFRRLGDRYGIAFSLREMGRASIGLGNLPKSHELLAESLSIFEALNDRLALAETLEHFAVLAAAEAEDEHALVLAGAAAALHETLGAPMTTQDRERMEQSLAESRGRLGEAAAASAFDGGRAMPLDRVAAIATRARLAK